KEQQFQSREHTPFRPVTAIPHGRPQRPKMRLSFHYYTQKHHDCMSSADDGSRRVKAGGLRNY
ncbi:MAG: hypothetical protein IKS92_05240, partial [Victivallales bacterium]|nr:hypothetical protein [Victivallales bacterium]